MRTRADDATPTVTTRVVLWPARVGEPFDSGDLSLEDANPTELAEFARDYAGVPLLELMQRLRRAEWNAAEYQRQAEQLQAQADRLPPMYLIEEIDARHKRLKDLVARPGRISRALLVAALSESDDTWNNRAEAS